MEMLAKKETGIGSSFVLVKYSDDFYAHGTEADIHDKYGFPVNSCGKKEEVLNHCNSIAKLCNENIQKYNKELIKQNNPDGWKLLIEREQKELEALTEFAYILSK